MKSLSNLHIIALACLDRAGKQRKTQYELMTEVNHIFALVEAPYSPGAFYPAMKTLSKVKLISINQHGCAIEPPGASQLRVALLSQPLPGSLLGVLYRLLAANLLADKATKEAAVKRIEIELIKFDQNDAVTDSEVSEFNLAPNSVRQHIGSMLRRILTDMRDN